MRSTRINRVLAATGLTAAAVLSMATPALAEERNGICEQGEFCYYYNSNNEGSISDFTRSVSDYGTSQPSCYDFKGVGNGRGECIKNNAASVWNRSSQTVRVHYNSGYSGSYQSVPPSYKGNLNSTLYNENASHTFGTSKINMSYALYELSGGRLTTGFDGYESTPGRHEGIDFARGLGSPVHALVSGKVTYVAEGYRGSSGLSTIAIYNSSYDKTIVYLHANPLSGLSAGESINKGQQIALEDYRGTSATHTHVEMRPGRQTRAAKSVNDYNLENPNPTKFWNSLGYNVR